MPRRYPVETRRQVIELARSGSRVAQLGATFGISEATIYSWLKQDRIDRGEIDGMSTRSGSRAGRGQAPDPPAGDRACAVAEGQRGVPQRGLAPKRLYPVIESLTGQGINVRHACRALGVSESGYYAWKGRPPSPTTLRRIWLAGEIADVHKASGGTYGALRVTAELRHGRQILVGHNAVGSIMGQLGIRGLPTRRLPKGARLAKVTSSGSRAARVSPRQPQPAVDDRHHRAPHPGGKVYCCIVLDAFSRLVVGWAVDSTRTTALVTNALGDGYPAAHPP